MSNRKTVIFQLYPAWVTAQESYKPAGLYITHRQLDCLENYHLRNLGKGLGEPWKFQELPVHFVDFLSLKEPPSRRKWLSSQEWLDSTIFKKY